MTDEAVRIGELRAAEARAVELFDAIVAAEVLRPGITELEASTEIRALAAEQFGVTQHWHKRIVRAGVNAMESYHAKTAVRTIEEDDIVYLDLGPVFDGWEADFGRTYVLGDDPRKHELAAALPVLFAKGRAHFETHPDITGSELYDYVVAESEAARWEFAGSICGHVVGEFPHDAMDGDAQQSRIAPGNDLPLRRNDSTGKPAHWILEIHLADRSRGIGGFYEQLLDV